MREDVSLKLILKDFMFGHFSTLCVTILLWLFSPYCFFVTMQTENKSLRMMHILMVILIWLFICCKTKLKKNFFWKNICVFYKIYIICRKKCFYMEKVLYWKIFLLKKTFFTEKNINENVKIYISFEKYIFMQKMFVLQIKYKSFLNIYSFCKKNFFDHKKYIC